MAVRTYYSLPPRTKNHRAFQSFRTPELCLNRYPALTIPPSPPRPFPPRDAADARVSDGASDCALDSDVNAGGGGGGSTGIRVVCSGELVEAATAAARDSTDGVSEPDGAAAADDSGDDAADDAADDTLLGRPDSRSGDGSTTALMSSSLQLSPSAPPVGPSVMVAVAVVVAVAGTADDATSAPSLDRPRRPQSRRTWPRDSSLPANDDESRAWPAGDDMLSSSDGVVDTTLAVTSVAWPKHSPVTGMG